MTRRKIRDFEFERDWSPGNVSIRETDLVRRRSIRVTTEKQSIRNRVYSGGIGRD